MQTPQTVPPSLPNSTSTQPADRLSRTPPFSAHRFTITASIAPLLEAASPDAASREVPGGRRLYLKYDRGTITSQGLENSLDALFDTDPAGLTRLFPGVQNGTARAAILTRLKEVIDHRYPSGGYPRGQVPEEWERLELQQNYFADHQVWGGLDGKLESSGDWALLRTDGVLTMDARFTIETNDGSLISVLMSAKGDLAGAYQLPGPEAYRRWNSGAPPNGLRGIPVTATFRFDVPGSPNEWATIAAKRYQRASQYYWKYVRLARQIFVGAGSIELGHETKPDVGYARAITLKVYELVA